MTTNLTDPSPTMPGETLQDSENRVTETIRRDITEGITSDQDPATLAEATKLNQVDPNFLGDVFGHDSDEDDEPGEDL